ncbi:MAG: hypothetical protein K2M05_00055, partial [Paramuribaculum sp.]|nr:hypothetical protein [Paramuribaculum sp.]
VTDTPPSVRAAKFYFTAPLNKPDSIDYLKKPNDSINFANGPVTLFLRSYDNTVTATYKVEILVHKTEPDSLMWDRFGSRNLPTLLQAPTSAGCVEHNDGFYCLTANNTLGCMAVAHNPGDENWAMTQVTLPEGTIASTLTSCGNSLYLLANSTIYRSDDAISWVSTGVKANHIYGSYGTKLLANVKAADGTWRQIVYPDIVDAETAPMLPEECPVSGTSPTLTFTSDWAAEPTTTFVGGRDAKGKLTGSSWAFDGTTWTAISLTPSMPREGMVLVPYFAFRSEQFWIIKKYSVLLAFCGTNDNAKAENTVYVSYDLGVHWAKAATPLQLPGFIAPYTGITPVVGHEELFSRSGSVWKEYAPLRLPSMTSRSDDRLITSWECPYIYLFGGKTSVGSLNMIVWRGVINRLTFQPLQ